MAEGLDQTSGGSGRYRIGGLAHTLTTCAILEDASLPPKPPPLRSYQASPPAQRMRYQVLSTTA